MTIAQSRTLSAILCADWGKEVSKRAVYVADIESRIVRRLPTAGWSLARVLKEAERWTSTGSVLATFDTPLGVPESYLTLLGRLPAAQPMATFLDLLTWARSMPRFYDATTVAREWIVERPFFSVPAGDGGLGTYVDAAARLGVDMYRQIDRMTGAKAVFIKSGVPGSVGSAACALWQELASQLTADRTFKVWPFEGELQKLLQSTSIVVGEMYPRAAYATALLDAPRMSRAPMVVAKTDAGIRREAIATLRAAPWVGSLRVELRDLAEAEANDDDFDACVTAAALLRCVLEGAPLCPSQLESVASEGGILGTGSVNFRFAAADIREARSRASSRSAARSDRQATGCAPASLTARKCRSRQRECLSVSYRGLRQSVPRVARRLGRPRRVPSTSPQMASRTAASRGAQATIRDRVPRLLQDVQANIGRMTGPVTQNPYPVGT